MRLFFYILMMTQLWGANSSASTLNEAKSRCALTTPGESFVYNNDYLNPAQHLDSSWWWSIPEMETLFFQIYNSGKRLNHRAYYDASSKQFLIPLKSTDLTYKNVVAPEFFIQSIRKHIESALKNKYAEYVFFPDMGHSHFYIEQSHWNTHYSDIVSKNPFDKIAIYNRMISDPLLKMLYHTAEQLLTEDTDHQRLSDPHLQYRYWNRNVLGDNQQGDVLEIHFPDPPNSGNTVGGIPGYKLWSAGYNIHSSKDGCFPYTFRGETFYYDISFEDLGIDPSAPQPVGDTF